MVEIEPMTKQRLAGTREVTINGNPMTRARWRKLFRKFATGGGSEVEALELASEVERQFYENRGMRAEIDRLRAEILKHSEFCTHSWQNA